MKIVIAVIFVLSVAGMGRGIKCYDCKDCPTVNATDLVECKWTLTKCEKNNKDGKINRMCISAVASLGEGCHTLEYTSCYCKTDGCNNGTVENTGTNTMHSPITFIPMIGTALIISILAAY